MYHIRPVLCPHCGYIDNFETSRSESIDSTTKDGEGGMGLAGLVSGRSKENSRCEYCDEKYGVRFNQIHKIGREYRIFGVGFTNSTITSKDFIPVKFGYLDELNVTYDVTVRRGPHVHTTIIPEDEFDPFRNGKRWFPIEGMNKSDVVKERVEGKVPAGNYYFIIGNDTDEEVEVEGQLRGTVLWNK